MPPAQACAWLQLLLTRGLGAQPAWRLVQGFGSPEAALAAPASRWEKYEVPRALHAAVPSADDPSVLAGLHWLSSAPQRHCLSRADATYPASLQNLSSPPLLLFVHGDASLLAAPQLAVVGARTATPQGLDNAHAFAREMARRGVIVTSGLALGVDGAAHRGALEARGATVAVCGTGLDRVYPARHRELAQAIVAQRGALVSEFAPGTPAAPQNFPRRNRLIAALSLGVLVVEAGVESGSLITARLAADLGREVFAIPGSIHNPLARGCHRLIRDGAKLVESLDDILLELAPQLGAWLHTQAAPAAQPAADAPLPEGDSARVWAALSDAPQSVDALITRSGLSAEAVNTALLLLELAGQAAAAPGGGYQRLQRQ